MCVMWMPANLMVNGIVDKNDKISFKKENKDTHIEEENTKMSTENKAVEEQKENK